MQRYMSSISTVDCLVHAGHTTQEIRKEGQVCANASRGGRLVFGVHCTVGSEPRLQAGGHLFVEAGVLQSTEQ